MPAVPTATSYRRLVLAGAVLATVWALAATARPDPVAATGPGAPPEADPPVVVVEVFYGEGCAACDELIDFLEDLAERLEGFSVLGYEVWFDAANRALMHQRGEELGRTVRAVPFTVVDRAEHWVGYSPAIGRQIEAVLVARLDPDAPDVPPPDDEAIIDVPWLGAFDVQGRSLLLATALIAVVDGVNPCSLWVLMVLLALVLHTGSRARVAAVGGTFLAVTTLVYGLFIVGVYSALTFVGVLGWIRGVVVAFALAFGVVNLKDYLWYGVGPSLRIPEQRKPGIYRRARGLVRPGVPLSAAMAGAGAMAAGVALVEIPCTAGFPVIWSEVVREADVSGAMFGALLGVYLVIYLVDELVILGVAVGTMRATRLQERHGRALKLVGGMVMVAVALTIAVAPDTMNRPSGVLVVFAAAVVASAVVAGLDRALRAQGGDRAGPGVGS